MASHPLQSKLSSAGDSVSLVTRRCRSRVSPVCGVSQHQSSSGSCRPRRHERRPLRQLLDDLSCNWNLSISAESCAIRPLSRCHSSREGLGPPARPAFAAKLRSRENERCAAGVAAPPFRPAVMARDLFTENARFSFGTEDPPFFAISRRLSGSMLANPRFPWSFSAASIFSTLSAIYSTPVNRYIWSVKDQLTSGSPLLLGGVLVAWRRNRCDPTTDASDR